MQHEVKKVKEDFDEKLKAKDLQLTILGERLKTVEGEILDLKNENKQLSNAIKTKDERLKKFEGQIVDLKTENKQMSDEIKTKDNKIAQLDIKRKELEGLVKANQDKNKKELKDIKKAIDDSKVESRKAKMKVDTFSHQIQRDFKKVLECC